MKWPRIRKCLHLFEDQSNWLSVAHGERNNVKRHHLYDVSFFFFTSAETLVTKSKTLTNPSDFAVAVDEEFGDFQFPDDFIFDIWGAVSDSKSGRW